MRKNKSEKKGKRAIGIDIELEKKTKLKFKGRKQSGRGILSMIIAILVLGCFGAASVYSAVCKGQGSIVVGWMGIGAFILSIPGFVLGIKAVREPDIALFPPIFGLVVNVIMMFSLLVLYLIGLF